jgi:hypothetical protein
MVRDAVANMVNQLRERGYAPRKVGHDAWESRCPGHRSSYHALSITRNEFNHVVLECRSAENCRSRWQPPPGHGLKSAGFRDWLIHGYLKSLTEFPIVPIVLPTCCNWISSNTIGRIYSILTHCIDCPTDML